MARQPHADDIIPPINAPNAWPKRANPVVKPIKEALSALTVMSLAMPLPSEIVDEIPKACTQRRTTKPPKFEFNASPTLANTYRGMLRRWAAVRRSQPSWQKRLARDLGKWNTPQ